MARLTYVGLFIREPDSFSIQVIMTYCSSKICWKYCKYIYVDTLVSSFVKCLDNRAHRPRVVIEGKNGVGIGKTPAKVSTG